MSTVVLDDHLVRDVVAGELSPQLRRVLRNHDAATTNLYLYRLCRSLVSAPGGALTGGWDVERRRALAAQLVAAADDIEVVPMRSIAFRMAEIADAHRVSTLGAEAAAAAERLAAPLCVCSGDDGPQIRAAVLAIGGDYRTIER